MFTGFPSRERIRLEQLVEWCAQILEKVHQKRLPVEDVGDTIGAEMVRLVKHWLRVHWIDTHDLGGFAMTACGKIVETEDVYAGDEVEVTCNRCRVLLVGT